MITHFPKKPSEKARVSLAIRGGKGVLRGQPPQTPPFQTVSKRPHRRAAVVLVALVLLANLLASAPRLAAATNYTVTWDPVQNVTRSGIKSVLPSVAVDSSDHLHIVYDLDTGEGGTNNLLYINNVSGSFSAPQVVETTIGTNAENFFSIEVGPNNTLHLIYSWFGNDERTYYRQATLNGATATWTARQQISDGTFGTAAANLAVDSSGNAHVVWIDKRCGAYQVFYRVRNANGSLGSISQPKPDCVFQNLPQIILSGGKPHVVFMSSNDITYARLEPTGWVQQNISRSPGSPSLNPTITSDGTAIYAAWDENINDHDIQFARSQDGGQNWSNIVSFSGPPTASFASFPNAVYSPTSQRVYVAWADDNLVGNRTTEIWYREFDPSDGTATEAKRLTTTPGASSRPDIAVGPGVAGITWQERDNNVLQIYTMQGDIAGGCSGALVLDGGKKQTKTSPVPAVITPSNCAPTQMQISVDKPPATDTPRVAYSSNFTVPVPAGGCAAHTVYVKLYENENSGNAASATITVDTVVTATVRALNPHMRNLPSVYTPGLNDAGGKGASDGHADYTRDRAFFLSVSDGGDCAGLQGFDVEGGIAGDVPTTGFVGVVALPGSAAAGARDFQVVISDTLNNTGMYPSSTNKYKLIYDPPSTSPSTPNTAGVPVLADGGSVKGDGSNKSIMRTLTFSGISVTDNLYGQQGENLSPGQQFWGVWIANSPNDNDQDNAELSWSPIQVPTPAASFSVTWSLFSGLDYGPDLTKAGNYYVYVRFLDGAGNPTANFLKVQLTLEAGYTVPTVRLPIQRR